MTMIADRWQESAASHQKVRHAYYFSAEFLMGRMIYNNLMCLDMVKEVGELLEESGASLEAFEDVEDCALGNGGLGRLAHPLQVRSVQTEDPRRLPDGGCGRLDPLRRSVGSAP